jgi:hypothetical protein
MNMKKCTQCLINKPFSDFAYLKRGRNQLNSKCKYCLTLNRRHRTKHDSKAIPPWFEAEKVAKVYQKAQEWGFVVDHIVPLFGETVSGLHCWANLQLLDIGLNSTKSNKEWPYK